MHGLLQIVHVIITHTTENQSCTTARTYLGSVVSEDFTVVSLQRVQVTIKYK